MRALLFVCLTVLVVTSNSQPLRTRTDSLFRRAFRSELYSQVRQQFLDSILVIDPKNAYAWQQKAMPLYKRKKYELGAPFLDSAVKYDPVLWLPYRAFMKCLFEKCYRDALADFRQAGKISETGIVMDHTFDFYSGLCHLQLNQFDSAITCIGRSLDAGIARIGEGHFFEYFYLGIAKAEKGDHPGAVKAFDRALAGYSRFSDAKYHKALSLRRLGKLGEADALLREARSDLAAGYTISEDNVIYEEYPYQLRNYWITARLKE